MRLRSPKEWRNNKLYDAWSAVHVVASAILTFLYGPGAAFFVATLWEPLENFVISPVLAKFGVKFGNESLQNALSDIVFNCIGIALALILQQIL